MEDISHRIHDAVKKGSIDDVTRLLKVFDCNDSADEPVVCDTLGSLLARLGSPSLATTTAIAPAPEHTHIHIPTRKIPTHKQNAQNRTTPSW